MKSFVAIIVVIIIVGLGWFFFGGQQAGAPESLNEENIMSDAEMTLVTFETTEGNIVIELFMEEMPITAGNFLKLAEEGFYTGIQFHRVIPGFVIQGGDPNTKGDDISTYGRGGPGYTIEDEFVEGLSNLRGTLSMANTGAPNSGGSQFFINLSDNLNLDFDKEPLASKHPVFGQVVEGMEVVDAIAAVETGPNDLPTEPVVIENVTISNQPLE